MWECEICGHQNPDEAEVCKQCGEIKAAPSYTGMPDDLVEDEDLGLIW